MNHSVRLRLIAIQSAPIANGAEPGPMGEEERVMLALSGPINLQWPVTYADAHDGMVEVGDLYELTLRKIPNMGARIGEIAVSGGDPVE